MNDTCLQFEIACKHLENTFSNSQFVKKYPTKYVFISNAIQL